VIAKTKFDGQVPRVSAPFHTPKPLFGENLQLKPMDSVSAHFSTTEKAIIAKRDQNIIQIELYPNCKIWGHKGHGLGHVTDLLKVWDPLNSS